MFQGTIPATISSMTCMKSGPDTFSWSQPISGFRCVDTCHLVIGGMDNSYGLVLSGQFHKLYWAVRTDYFTLSQIFSNFLCYSTGKLFFIKLTLM